jgi:hypothetical protein
LVDEVDPPTVNSIEPSLEAELTVSVFTLNSGSYWLIASTAAMMPSTMVSMFMGLSSMSWKADPHHSRIRRTPNGVVRIVMMLL